MTVDGKCFVKVNESEYCLVREHLAHYPDKYEKHAIGPDEIWLDRQIGDVVCAITNYRKVFSVKDDMYTSLVSHNW